MIMAEARGREAKHTMLAESAIQKATKFHQSHFLRCGSTGSDQYIFFSFLQLFSTVRRGS